MKLNVPDDGWVPSPAETPFQKLGGENVVKALVESFYDAMEAHEPELARLHQLDAGGKISREFRDRFALFLVLWLGGPQTYMEKHGHPRLRMRHGHVRVDKDMRDAWLRSMTRALDAHGVKGGLRTFLDARFADVADFLRNVAED